MEEQDEQDTPYRVCVKVRNMLASGQLDKNDEYYHLSRYTPMEKLMNHYCRKRQLRREMVCFVSGNQEQRLLRSTTTFETLDFVFDSTTVEEGNVPLILAIGLGHSRKSHVSEQTHNIL